jgi:hypothetical protein
MERNKVFETYDSMKNLSAPLSLRHDISLATCRIECTGPMMFRTKRAGKNKVNIDMLSWLYHTGHRMATHSKPGPGTPFDMIRQGTS